MHRIGIALILLSGPAYGQTYDHLEPDDSIFRTGWSLDYYTNVARVLGDVLPWRAPKVVIPGGIYEHVVGIDDSDDSCLIVVGTAEHSLWSYESEVDDPEIAELRSALGYPDDPLDVQVNVNAKPAPTLLCDRVRDAWVTMLLRTRYPDPDVPSIIVVDGVSYHFSVWLRGMGLLSGKIDSPNRQSVPGKMVEVVRAMRNYARTGMNDDIDAVEATLAEFERELE